MCARPSDFCAYKGGAQNSSLQNSFRRTIFQYGTVLLPIMLCRVWSFLVIIFTCRKRQNHSSDLFPPLKDLERFSAPGTGYGSRQNTTYCCLQAVDHAFTYSHGELRYNNQSDVKINVTPEDFKTSAANGQFPCSAKYVAGENSGAPQVQVTHIYCVDTCGRGWDRSQFSSSSEWVSAFIGFIIPAIVFCK